MNIEFPLPHQIPGLRSLWQEAFGDDDAFLDLFFSTAFSPRRCRCIASENRIAAALYWFDCGLHDQKAAYIYAVATGKAFRGQGLCRRLMEDTHRHLKALGYAGAVLVPGEKDLFSMYRGMGYETVSSILEFSCAAAPEMRPLRRIGIREYAGLRRELLPGNSILQEGENLEFLQTQADLYAGEGFVLAARKNGSKLFAPELLGDLSAAPEILTALDCAAGTFRAPGEGRPFAMYHPLNTDARPEYFGLAFD